MSRASRILDLDPVLDSLRRPFPPMLRIVTRSVSSVSRIHGDYDATDATKFDSLPQGLARHPGQTATATDQPFGHQGLLYEPEITSYQNRARQYLANMHRFAQRDALGYGDGLNHYGYLGGNPLSNRDPSGMTYLIPEAQDIVDAALDIGIGIGIEIITSIPIGTIYGPAFSHCLSHCIITRKTNRETSETVGDITEDIQVWVCACFGLEGQCNSANQRTDYWDNELGRVVAGNHDVGCYSGCKDKMGGETTHPEGSESNRPYGPHAVDEDERRPGGPGDGMPEDWGPAGPPG